LLFEPTDTVTGPELELHLPFTQLSDMVVLDKRLYTSHHAPTDTVARVGPDCVKLALNGCSFLQSTEQLSLQRDRTYNPHPCTVLTAAHNIHTLRPDAPARLAYQRTLMNPYCMFDPADLASETIGTLSRSHTVGPASTSLVSDAETCPTRKTLRQLKLPVVSEVTFRGPDLEILGTSSWTLGGRIWAIDNGLGPAPAVPAYGPSMERAGTRVCGYAIKNSGLTVV